RRPGAFDCTHGGQPPLAISLAFLLSNLPSAARSQPSSSKLRALRAASAAFTWQLKIVRESRAACLTRVFSHLDVAASGGMKPVSSGSVVEVLLVVVVVCRMAMVVVVVVVGPMARPRGALPEGKGRMWFTAFVAVSRNQSASQDGFVAKTWVPSGST